MPEFALPDGPALDELARTDLLLDALGQRERFDIDDPSEDVLAALLGDWRDDLRWPPASALVSPEEAVAALREGLEERLGWDTAPEDAGAAKPFALDHGDGKPELGGSNGAHITGRAAAKEDHVKGSHKSISDEGRFWRVDNTVVMTKDTGIRKRGATAHRDPFSYRFVPPRL